MNTRRSKLMQLVVVTFVVMGLLTAAWPGLALDDKPQPDADSKHLFEQRVREPSSFEQFLGTVRTGVSLRSPALTTQANNRVTQPTTDYSVFQWSTVAFARGVDLNTNNFELFTIDYGVLTQRTYHPAYDSMPSLNRGANRLAFISNRNGNNEIYTMNIDSSQLTRLTVTPAHEYWPRWSPDGSKIVFYSYRDGNAEIYVMNANGSNQTRLTNNPAWDGHPAWSPDGTQIIFSSDRTSINDLWVMNADGSNPHQLTFGLDAYYPA